MAWKPQGTWYHPEWSEYAQPQGVSCRCPSSLSTQHFGPLGSGAGAGSALAMPLPSSTVAAQAATINSFFVTGRILSVRSGHTILRAMSLSRDF